MCIVILRLKRVESSGMSDAKRTSIPRVFFSQLCISTYFRRFYVYLLPLFWALLPYTRGLVYIVLNRYRYDDINELVGMTYYP